MNTKQWMSIPIAAVLLITAGGLALWQHSPQTPTGTPSQPTLSSTGSGDKTYTLADVAAHHTASSCWTSINGGVYDVTGWIRLHPGGTQPILSLCGTDGSSAFNDQHGGQPRPAAELEGFKIGTLSK